MKYDYQIGDEVVSIEVEREGDYVRVMINDRVYRVWAESKEGALTLELDGRRLTAWVAAEWVGVGSATAALPKAEKRKRRAGAGADHDHLTAAMPGQVRAVLIAPEDQVEKGQTLLLLEAMKMEIKVVAPHAGKVAQVLVQAGQVVERGQQLVEITH